MFQEKYSIDPDVTENMYDVGRVKRALPLDLIAVHDGIKRLKEIKAETNARLGQVHNSNSLTLREKRDEVEDIVAWANGERRKYEVQIRAGLKYARDQILDKDPYFTGVERRNYKAALTRAEDAYKQVLIKQR